MQKKYVFFAMLFAGVLALSGCAYQSPESATQETPDQNIAPEPDEQGGIQELENESAAKDEHNQVRQYLTDHIREYAPQDPVLGGTWYVTDIRFEEGKNRALVDYEDGHIAVKAIVDFRIEQNNTIWVSAIPAYFDDREAINAKVGDRFAVVLASNPSTGFSWIGEDAEDASRPVARMDSGFITGASEQDIALGMVGIGGADYIIYDAMNTGSEDIKLMYARPWESVQPEDPKIFHVLVQ